MFSGVAGEEGGAKIGPAPTKDKGGQGCLSLFQLRQPKPLRTTFGSSLERLAKICNDVHEFGGCNTIFSV